MIGSQLDNPSFRRWFGDSVVVDENGDPLVVYHGTASDFSVFRSDRIGEATDAGTLGAGFYFTTLIEAAQSYAVAASEKTGGQPKIIHAYLRIENPWPAPRRIWQLSSDPKAARKHSTSLKKQGFDGVFFHIDQSVLNAPSFDEFVVFDPRQIKSATDNDGSFDPENPDVRKNPPSSEPRPGSPLDNPAFRRWFGDSVVVDRSGLPAVVYHGGFDIESAKVPAFRASKRSGYGAGIYLTPLRDVAQSYAQENNGVVGEYYARVENPLLVLWNGAAQALIDLGWTPQKAKAKIEREEEQYGGVAGVIQSAAREKGYDGLFVLTKDASANLPEELEVARDVREIVLFDGWQAKSANKSLGTYERWGTDVTRNPERTFIPPQKVADEAAYGLYLRSQMPPSNRCCTAVGLARAKQLKNREPVSVETLKRMRSYFQRHAVDKKGARWAIDSKGFQAWLLWGGDSGQDWCNRTLEQLRE